MQIECVCVRVFYFLFFLTIQVLPVKEKSLVRLRLLQELISSNSYNRTCNNSSVYNQLKLP